MEEKTNEMLTYDAFFYVLHELSDKLQYLKNRMHYQEIVIKNKYDIETEGPFKRIYYDEMVVKNDPEYVALTYQHEIVEHQIRYLNETGRMPADCDIEIPEWMEES